MKIIHSFPPNIEDIVKRFGKIPAHAVFTYGDTLHVPSRGYIHAALLTHEETHTKQQGEDPAAWWKKYLEDDKFRLDQEIEAYRNQYQHFCRNKKDLFKQAEFLEVIASDLSGPMYGNVVTLEEAKQLIKQ